MRTQPYSCFWKRIHGSAKKEAFPLRVMFELTYRCNLFCRHCYVPLNYRKYKELKTREIFSILDQLADMGCFYLGFTGGEPFIREDIMKILWYAKRKGFEIIIYTNGSLIDEKIADELGELVPNKVDITISAMSKESFERITGVPGSHKKVFNAIELLYKKGVKLGFKSCVLKDNEREIEDIQKFAESLGALHRLDDMLSPRLDGSKEPYRYRGRLKDKLHAPRFTLHADCDLDATDVKKATKDQLPINQLLTTNNLFKCGVGISQVAITPLGELKMCPMIDYPKYKILDGEDRSQRSEVRRQRTEGSSPKLSLKDAWRKLKDFVSSIKPDGDYKCDGCELQAYCKWCPASSWLYNKNFTSCEPESRRKAEAIRNLVHSQGSIIPQMKEAKKICLENQNSDQRLGG